MSSSDELATYNNLSVGDTITVVNPNEEEEGCIRYLSLGFIIIVNRLQQAVK